MFHKQKTTEITLIFPKIIEMHLIHLMHIASYATGTKREKKEFRQKEKFKFVCAHSGIELTRALIYRAVQRLLER
jgi:hypothetical protein